VHKVVDQVDLESNPEVATKVKPDSHNEETWATPHKAGINFDKLLVASPRMRVALI